MTHFPAVGSRVSDRDKIPPLPSRPSPNPNFIADAVEASWPCQYVRIDAERSVVPRPCPSEAIQ